MRKPSLIALLCVSVIVALNNLSNVCPVKAVVNHQDDTKPALPKLGTERPELSFQLLSGRLAPTWQALEGRVVVMDFWATWCAPCIAAIPRMNELHTKFEKKKSPSFPLLMNHRYTFASF